MAGLTEEAMGHSLRLQDSRGTSTTRLLSAGLSLAKTASHMGWSARYAAAIIGQYDRVSPEELTQLWSSCPHSERAEPEQCCKRTCKRSVRQVQGNRISTCIHVEAGTGIEPVFTDLQSAA